jgi:hypothetical protein
VLDGPWWRPILFVVVPLVVIYAVTFLARASILTGNGYSEATKGFTAIWLAPPNEESLKVFPAVLVGAVISLALKRISTAKEGALPLRTKRLLKRHPILRSWAGFATRHRQEITYLSALVVFLYVAEWLALYEVNGGTLDGGQLSPNEAVLKIIGHASFSFLAVPIAMEASRRAPLFILIGYGFHSGLNVVTVFVRPPYQAIAIGVLLIAFVFLDIIVTARWWRQLRTREPAGNGRAAKS